MKTIIISIGLILFSINVTFAQSRFDQFVSEGKAELKAQNFEKAINKFKAAKITPDISADQIRLADQQIESARDGFIAAIQKANEETKIALEKAQVETKISEANRLAFLANQYVEKGNYEEAFQVASIAMNMVKDNAPNLVEKAFGDAGYHQFSKTLENEKTPVLKIHQTNDGKHFVVLSRDQAPLLFDNSGNLIQRMTGHKSRVVDLAISKNNDEFATCSEDGVVNFWNEKGVLKSTFESDNQLFARRLKHLSRDEYLAVFSDNSFKVLSSNGTMTFAVKEESRFTNLVSSPNGKYFVSCSAKGRAKLWNAESKSLIRELESSGKYIYQAIFSKDGEKIFLVAQDYPVLVFDLSGKLISTFKSKALSESAYELNLAPDGEHLAVASENGLVEIWNTQSDFITSFQRKKDQLGLLKFSPDSKKIVSVYDDQSFVLWDIEKKDSIFFDQHNAAITELSFSPDGQYLLSASKDHTAKLWNLNGSVLTNLNLHKAPINTAQFSKDGNYILTGGMDHQIYLSPTFQTILKHSDEVVAKKMTKSQKEEWGMK